jgi:hypothetical protein
MHGLYAPKQCLGIPVVEIVANLEVERDSECGSECAGTSVRDECLYKDTDILSLVCTGAYTITVLFTCTRTRIYCVL